MRRQKVTRRSVNKYKEDILLAWTPTLMRELMLKLHTGLCDEDDKAIGRVMELLGLVQPKGGVSIVNTLVQGQTNNNGGYGSSFDNVVRKLAKQLTIRLPPLYALAWMLANTNQFNCYAVGKSRCKIIV